MADRFRLDMQDGRSAVKVLLWAAVSAVITVLIELIPQVELPGGLVPWIPVVNAALVALKKFFEQK